MKPSLLIFAFLVLFSCIVVSEGEMRTLDFSNSSSLLVQIGVGDGVRFDWADKNHKMVIGAVNKDEQRVEITNFIEGSPVPYYTSITPKTFLELDFERDDVKDMKVSLIKFVDDKTVVLFFEKVSEPEVVEEAEQLWPNFTGFFSVWPFSNVYYNLALYALVIILILVFIFSSRFVRRKYRRFRRSMVIG